MLPSIRKNELDVHRIQNLTDALFAIVLTFLSIGMIVPRGLNHTNLITYLLNENFPKLLIFFLSFIIIGAFWVDSHYHHHLVVKTDKISTWLNIFFLMFISIIPFSSSFLANYRHDVTSISNYSINLLAASICNLLMLVYAWHKKFLRPLISLKLYKNLLWRLLFPIIIYSLIIPLSFLISEWVIYLFLIPILFQIFFGNANQESSV